MGIEHVQLLTPSGKPVPLFSPPLEYRILVPPPVEGQGVLPPSSRAEEWPRKPSAASHRAWMSVEEANRKAMQLVRGLARKTVFFKLSLREQARRIGCHVDTWKKTELYRTAKKEGRLRKQKPRRAGGPRKVVTLSPTIEAMTADKNAQEALAHLVAEQAGEAENDPSPLDDSARPRKARARKRL
jgi:hypothetical protein